MPSKPASGSNFIMIILVLIVLGIVLKSISSETEDPDGFAFNNSEYQYSNPNVKRQYDYYKCISDECGGNTHDYPCLSVCRLKIYRKGMKEPDIQDLVCQSHFDDPKAYYNCLSSVYNDYKFP